MSGDTDKKRNDLDHLGKLLQELPVRSPSRDLVSAAIEEARPGNRNMAWWLSRAIGAAAAVFVLVVGLPQQKGAVEPTPSDADIAGRLSEMSKRSAKIRSRIHVATYDSESSSLSDRIKRARRKSKASKQRLNREEEGHV